MSTTMLSGHQFTVTTERIDAFKRLRKRFGCLLCGHQFAQGDNARFILANYKDSPFKYGNFFVCPLCDCGDNVVILRNATILANRLKETQELVDRVATQCREQHL